MKNLFTLIALGFVTLATADQYYQPYESDSGSYRACGQGGRDCQGQQSQYQDSSYYQRNNYTDNSPQHGYAQPNYQREDQQYNSYGQQPRTQNYSNYQRDTLQSNGYAQQPRYENTANYQRDAQVPVSTNQEIGKKIFDALSAGWFTKGFQDVTFSVNQGYVVLRGTIDTLDNKNKIEDTVKKINGVKQVDNQITVVAPDDKNSKSTDSTSDENKPVVEKVVPDQEISRKVYDALSDGWFSKGYQGISFDIKDGVVNLKGSIDTLENKNKVEESIKEIKGVKQVNNKIVIVPGSVNLYTDSQLQASEKKYPQDSAATYLDRQLNAKIREKLSGGWFSKGNETVIIRTSNGYVILNGAVDKTEDINKVNDQVKEIEGVKSVNNQLTVKSK